jgi:signal transduction histidine kinase
VIAAPGKLSAHIQHPDESDRSEQKQAKGRFEPVVLQRDNKTLRYSALRTGGSMLEQPVNREPRLKAGSLRNIPGHCLIAESVSASSQLIAYICHDLRLPLTAILANAEFLTQSGMSEMERADIYREIQGSIDRMDELISSLLEYSKGPHSLRPAVRNIVDIVKRAIRMTRVKPEFRRITIEHHHNGLAVGWFDSNLLERALANLVQNASEAVSPDSGQIVITTNGDTSHLQISVWDNGPGIPPMIQEFVFRPFVSYGKTEGSGLGLAIAKRIVEDHGGEIRLDESGEPGTLFKITIPYAIPQVTKPHVSAGPIRSRRTSTNLVLQADTL